MKRAGSLRRRAPLRAKSGGLKRSGGLKSAKGIDRKPPKSHQTPKKRPRNRLKALPWEIAHLKAVKRLPCRSCGAAPCDAHHCYHDRATKFGGRKAPHNWTIPLCKACHQDGPDAIHRIKRTWRKRHGPDHSHVGAVLVAIYGNADIDRDGMAAWWAARGVS